MPYTAMARRSRVALEMRKRNDGLSHMAFYPAMGANLCPFGAPPFRGRREKFKILPSMGKATKREYRCPALKAFPSRGRCPEGIGHWRYERKWGKRLKFENRK